MTMIDIGKNEQIWAREAGYLEFSVSSLYLHSNFKRSDYMTKRNSEELSCEEDQIAANDGNSVAPALWVGEFAGID